MRKIRIFEPTSLDGVIPLPGDSDFARGGWSARELALVSTKVSPTGMLINTYRHVESLSVNNEK